MLCWQLFCGSIRQQQDRVHTMRVSSAAIFLALFFAVLSSLAGVPPERPKGISIHMLPKQVADIDAKKWGFVVTYAEYLKAEASQPVLQSTSEFLDFMRKQGRTVQDNGVWIVTTHPSAYSAPETKLLEDVKALCRRESIPLFVVRGSQLPNGWQRYDNAP
jgi:hypothetical protein